jgi:hypothetical protein
MKKVIEIKGNGFVWTIDLHAIAHNRAEYYAAEDSDTTYKREYDFVMNDDYEGIDWYQNNMNWADVPGDSKRLVKTPDPIDGPDLIEDPEYDIKEEQTNDQ